MKEHRCADCPIRAKYDRDPKSLAGRFWRWHIGFCPGWRRYFASLDDEQKEEFRIKYNLKSKKI